MGRKPVRVRPPPARTLAGRGRGQADRGRSPAHHTAASAELHLQPFPGTDAALAFAILHVLRRDGLLAPDFIAAHTVGYDQLEPLIDDCTPEWGAAVTGVPAELIVRAAHIYGAGPSLLWIGQGLQRQPTGGNVVRACALLPP